MSPQGSKVNAFDFSFGIQGSWPFTFVNGRSLLPDSGHPVLESRSSSPRRWCGERSGLVTSTKCSSSPHCSHDSAADSLAVDPLCLRWFPKRLRMTSRPPIISCSTGAEGSLVLKGVSQNRLVDMCRVAKTKIVSSFHASSCNLLSRMFFHLCLATYSTRHASGLLPNFHIVYLIGSHAMDLCLLLIWPMLCLRHLSFQLTSLM